MRLLALALVLLAAAPVAGARVDRARVWVVDESPFTVSGSGFQPRELVRVTVRYEWARTKTVAATATGRIRATFPAVELGRCAMYSIVASGNEGSRATMRVIPDCAQPLVP